MRSSSFFKGLSWLLVLNLLVKPVWIFLIDRQVQNIVGHEEYGRYFATLNLSLVLFFLADAGLSTMINQRIAAQKAVHLGQLFRLKLVLLLVYTSFFFFLAWLSGITRWDLVFYLLLIQLLTSLFLFLRSVITAHQFFFLDAWLSVLDKFLMTAFCGAIIYSSWLGNMNLPLFLKIQTLCTATAVLLALGTIWSKGWIRSGSTEPNSKILKAIAPFAVILLLMGLHSRLDGFLLERIHINGAYEAGIYASAYRLLDAANMAGYLAGSFLIPFVARNSKDKELVASAVSTTKHGLLFLGVAVLSFVLVFAPWLQELLYHSSDDYGSRVIQLCLAVLPAYYLIHIYGAVLTATENFGAWIRILCFSAAINVILNVVWIPYYGAQGCCMAALASQYFCAIAVYITASIKTGMKFQNRMNIVYVLTGVALSFFFYMGKKAQIGVWTILAVVSSIVLLLLATQLKFLKKYFISLR